MNQWSSVKFNKVLAWRAKRAPPGERSEPLQLQGLCWALLEIADNLLESYDICWKLLGHVGICCSAFRSWSNLKCASHYLSGQVSSCLAHNANTYANLRTLWLLKWLLKTSADQRKYGLGERQIYKNMGLAKVGLTFCVHFKSSDRRCLCFFGARIDEFVIAH